MTIVAVLDSCKCFSIGGYSIEELSHLLMTRSRSLIWAEAHCL